MAGIHPAVVSVSGGNLVLVLLVLLISLGALGMAWKFLLPVKAPTT
jgi:K(+)-stimulated pyrophosphate-energized sodium pump